LLYHGKNLLVFGGGLWLHESVKRTSSKVQPKESLFLSLLINIIVPAVILMNFSGESSLGPAYALVAALAFPLCYGIADAFRNRRVNLYSALGLVSVLLTGGVGLLELDKEYIAWKEALIPLIVGLVVLATVWSEAPFMRAIINQVVDRPLLEKKLRKKKTTARFERAEKLATLFFAGSFLVSALLNFVLAKLMIVSPSGTEAFNQELGQMALVSYPVIVIPSMIVVLGVILYVFRSIKRTTGEPVESFLKG